MKRRAFLASTVAGGFSISHAAPPSKAAIRIVLNATDAALSMGQLTGSNSTFPVGLGRNGFLPAGDAFRGGYSLLGSFRVNAILSSDRFEMTEELISESGKSREWLAQNLFRNMSSIDFDGDGEGGEYGTAFIGLEPLDSEAKQPFHFGEYKGVFRWYSYAIHGTQDESRVGKCVTGGCINVKREDLFTLLEKVQLGSPVEVTAAG